MRRAKLGAAVILSTGLLAACDAPSPPAGTVVAFTVPETTTTVLQLEPEVIPAKENPPTTEYDWGPVLCETQRHPRHHDPCPAYVAPPVTSGGLRPSTATTAPAQRRTAAVESAGGTPPEYVKQCESGGDYGAVNPNGHYGAWQFSISTWQSVGGTGNPADASPAEQDKRAAILWANGAGAGHWSCA